MRWPWVSVQRLDDLRVAAEQRAAQDAAQIAWLRQQNEQLRDALTRISRKEVGLPETPRAPRPVLEPMPKSLHDYFDGFANKRASKMMRDEAYREHAAGFAWADIAARILTPPETEESPWQ